MFQVQISGNLVAPPKQVSMSKGGAIYAINMACNHWEKSKDSGQIEKKVYWVGGLIYENKIKKILPYLKKGTYVFLTSNTAGLGVYQSKKTGKYEPKLELKLLQTLEAGNLDRSDNGSNGGWQPSQPPQAPLQAPGGGPYAPMPPQPHNHNDFATPRPEGASYQGDDDVLPF